MDNFIVLRHFYKVLDGENIDDVIDYFYDFPIIRSIVTIEKQQFMLHKSNGIYKDKLKYRILNKNVLTGINTKIFKNKKITFIFYTCPHCEAKLLPGISHCVYCSADIKDYLKTFDKNDPYIKAVQDYLGMQSMYESVAQVIADIQKSIGN